MVLLVYDLSPFMYKNVLYKCKKKCNNIMSRWS